MAHINSFIRIPLLALRQSIRPLPRIGILDRDCVHMRVWPNDIDFNFHLNNSRFLTFMDYGRMHMLAATGVLTIALRRRWTPLIGSVDIVYRRSLPVFTAFTLTTQTVGWDEMWLYMEQTITFAGDLSSVAWVKALFREGNRNVRPQSIVDMTQPGLASPPLSESLVKWNELTREKIQKAERESFSPG